MSKETKESEVQTEKAPKIRALPAEKKKEKKEEKVSPQYQLQPPRWNVLNGSQKICLQKFTADWEPIKPGSPIIHPGSTNYDPPSPNEVRQNKQTRRGDKFFIVAYDDDINLAYRKAKLDLLGLPEFRGSRTDAEKQIEQMEAEIKKLKAMKGTTAKTAKENHTRLNNLINQMTILQKVLKLEEVGALDVLCLGDQVHFNVEHFLPVDMGDDYYVIHYTDMLGIEKDFPRFRLERQHAPK